MPNVLGSSVRGRPCGAVGLLGGAAVLALVAVGGCGWASVLAGMAVAVVAVAAAYHVARCQRSAVEQVAGAGAVEQARLVRFCSLSAPLWVRQIETACREGDTEIAELSHAFGEIVQRLERSMCGGARPGASGETSEAVAVLRSNARDLSTLVDALKSLQARNGHMVAQVASESKLLQESASEIRQIALRTRVVAMNATIEAARAGAAGRAFAVIVSDMRELAARTAEFSEQCTRRAEGLHALVSTALSERAGGRGEQHTASIAWAQQLVEQVIARFEAAATDMHRSVGQLETERAEVRGDVARALVALQFQDRVSQILGHVANGIDLSSDALRSGGWAGLDERQWLQRVSSTYSTPEEFRNLEGTQAAPRPESGVTFF
jgi:methyl-accepting chemotaxis protein